jgi:hypothetical protein
MSDPVALLGDLHAGDYLSVSVHGYRIFQEPFSRFSCFPGIVIAAKELVNPDEPIAVQDIFSYRFADTISSPLPLFVKQGK